MAGRRFFLTTSKPGTLGGGCCFLFFFMESPMVPALRGRRAVRLGLLRPSMHRRVLLLSHRYGLRPECCAELRFDDLQCAFLKICVVPELLTNLFVRDAPLAVCSALDALSGCVHQIQVFSVFIWFFVPSRPHSSWSSMSWAAGLPGLEALVAVAHQKITMGHAISNPAVRSSSKRNAL